ERKAVAAIAPHLASRVRFVVTARSRAGMAKFKAGLWTYEKLGSIDADDRHEVWNQKALSAAEPHLKTEGLAGAIVYTEYVTDDGRLTLANIRSAKGHGATVANYAQVTAIATNSLTVRDALTDASAQVTAKVIVNATGPWAMRCASWRMPARPPDSPCPRAYMSS
ncbi:MAG: FAD-dependent oxidoreductase, partial [Gammaproteobacteria bacterium]|nr:FAD-dependent oxidoreductase [Gammaproteobacteria bacterium]